MPTAPSQKPIVQMSGIVKRFGLVVANDCIDLTLFPGEVLALLGENGAGKTTLMNILFGFLQPDGGTIHIRDQEVRLRSPKDALARGIGMVHQHMALVPPHTVLENIVVGLPAAKSLLRERKALRTKIRELADRYGLHIDPDAPVWQLSMGERQRVEILKVLYRGAEILILDEPTSVLTPQESRELASTLRHLVRAGHTVVYISHKLKEVLEVSDRVVVLRQGKVVAQRRTEDVDRAELARLMVGRNVLERVRKTKSQPGPVLLTVQDLRTLNDKGLPALTGVSFTIRSGEILGLAGVSGNGQTELADVLSGVRTAQEGSVHLDGTEITNRSPREINRGGIGRVPEDRMARGLLLDLPLTDNAILAGYRTPPFSRRGFLNRAAIHEFSEKLVRDFDIRTPSVFVPTVTLSGGNLQKLLLARELSQDLRLLIVSHPTRGLDIGAAEYIHNRLLEQKERGVGILLISEDLDEILMMSDRIAVMYNGQIVDVLGRDEAHLDLLGALMAGIQHPSGVQG